MQNDDNFVYDDMYELIEQVNSNEDFLKTVPREKFDKEPTPEEFQTMSLSDLFKFLSDKFNLGFNAFLNFLELSSEFRDELDEFYNKKIAEIESMTPEEQEHFDFSEFWKEQIDYVLQLKNQHHSETKDKIKKDEAVSENLPIISNINLEQVKYPLDKLNSVIDKLEFNKREFLKVESDQEAKRNKTADIQVLISLSESGITTSRTLSPFQKRAVIVIANLKEQGYDVVTTNQIYGQMGGRGVPSARDKEKIINSLSLMMTTLVDYDNTEEANLHGCELVKTRFNLIDIKIQAAYINGTIVKDAIHIKEIPEILKIASMKKQVTSIPQSLFESPLSMTDSNFRLEDYCIRRIAREKNDVKKGTLAKFKMLTKTVFNNCGISTKMQKVRAYEKIERLLEFYKKEEFISDFYFSEEEKGFILSIVGTKAKKLKDKKSTLV